MNTPLIRCWKLSEIKFLLVGISAHLDPPSCYTYQAIAVKMKRSKNCQGPMHAHTGSNLHSLTVKNESPDDLKKTLRCQIQSESPEKVSLSPNDLHQILFVSITPLSNEVRINPL